MPIEGSLAPVPLFGTRNWFQGNPASVETAPPSLSVNAKSALGPVVRLEMNVRPVDWSVTRMGSSDVTLEIDGLTSCHSVGPASGSAGVRFSGGVTRKTSPHELVRMFPVFGSK